MKFLTLSILCAISFAGCSTNDDPVFLDPEFTPGYLRVEQMHESPAKYVEWSKIPEGQRPSELPPLFSKALENQPNGISGQEISDERGKAIIDGLNVQWREQVGSSPAPPRPVPVHHNGEYYDVMFGASSTRSAN